MTELALRAYIQTQLNANEVLPTGTGRFKTFKAHRQMFKRDVLGANVVLQVGRMHSKEKREAGARGIGKKLLDWSIDLLVVANGKDPDLDADDFSVLVDNTKKVFRQNTSTPLPATLTDPQTSETSVLTHIGEEIDHETLDPDMEATQGRILFRARITMTAKEIITFY